MLYNNKIINNISTFIKNLVYIKVCAKHLIVMILFISYKTLRSNQC